MRYSYIDYSGDGATAQFSVTFGYLSKAHISVTVDGVDAPFTWFNASTVQLADPPAVGTVVRVRRVTPKDEALVDFSDASVLTETDLDLATLQNLYVAQEADDKAEDIRQSAIDAAVDIAVPAATAAAVAEAVPAATIAATSAAIAAAVPAAVAEATELATAAATAAAVAEATIVAEQVATETSRSVPEVEIGDANKVLVATPGESPPYAWLDPLTPIMNAASAAQSTANTAVSNAAVAQTTADAAAASAATANASATAANTNANGRVSKTGDILTGTLSVSPASGTPAVIGVNATGAADSVVLARSDAGRSAAVQFNTGVNARWQIRKNATAESGSNAGSDLVVDAYNDNGTLLGTAVAINRSGRNVAVTGSLSAAGLLSTSGIFLNGYDSAGGSDFGKAIFFNGSWTTNAMYIQSAHTPGVNAWMNIVCGPGWMQLNNAGNLTVASNAFKPGGGAWADSSDRRFKDRIEPYRTGLQAVVGLSPQVYSFKAETGRDPERRFIGAIAQDVEDVMPEMVSIGRQTHGDMTLEDARSLDPSALPWALVNAIKELKAKLDAAEARIAQLEGTAP